jgi:Na+/phosphate symporter
MADASSVVRVPDSAVSTSQRAAPWLLLALTTVAVMTAWLPPLIPPTYPGVRLPLWITIAVLSGGLALVLFARPMTARWILLTAGWSLVAMTVIQSFVIGDLIAMFSTWLSVPVLALLVGELRPKPRKALVAAHAVFAACWVGVGLTFVAMSVVAMSTTNIRTTQAVYELMAVFDITLLPWTNFGTILTGIALSMTTKWGLIRYYWVAAKIAIAVGILVMAFGFLHDALERAAHEAAALAAVGGTAAQISGASDVVLWGFGVALLSLVGALLLSLYKPGGRIRRSQSTRPATKLAVNQPH